GNYVVVKHDDGYWTYYGHLDSVDLVVGEKVTTSSRVGIMGSTGLAKGIHLHFEVWKGGQWKRINPRDVINF
ncbi:M23 family metallopeptidase, partial [Enterococcus faecalis]